MKFSFEQCGTERLFAIAHSVTLDVDADGNVALFLAVDDDREITIGGGRITASAVRSGVIETFDDVKDLAAAVDFLTAPRSSIA